MHSLRYSESTGSRASVVQRERPNLFIRASALVSFVGACAVNPALDSRNGTDHPGNIGVNTPSTQIFPPNSETQVPYYTFSRTLNDLFTISAADFSRGSCPVPTGASFCATATTEPGAVTVTAIGYPASNGHIDHVDFSATSLNVSTVTGSSATLRMMLRRLGQWDSLAGATIVVDSFARTERDPQLFQFRVSVIHLDSTNHILGVVPASRPLQYVVETIGIAVRRPLDYQSTEPSQVTQTPFETGIIQEPPTH